ncbi:hypothetical protein F511_16695 [Dorcoceras hygrometricum]|uniref:Dolichol-phosphate mannosyltransferase subunit 3 n=1 Tax=Dorcoceras hygrometricum TaxID=472368 RepID=A0A2Z7CQ40_9LAMI|nr:hypothetical protein F511_16695 [Dorcoceras hygrometricum]
MKHIVKILTLLVTLSALWVGLLQASIIPKSYTWLLPLYFIVSLGCYGLLMVGVGLMQFPTCPQEAILLQQVCTKFHSLTIVDHDSCFVVLDILLL